MPATLTRKTSSSKIHRSAKGRAARTGKAGAKRQATAGRATKSSASAYDQLIALVKDASLLGSTGAILSWDQETMMPTRGVEHRSRQLAQVAKLSHEMATSKRIGELISECERDSKLTKDPLSVAAVNVREIRHDYD